MSPRSKQERDAQRLALQQADRLLEGTRYTYAELVAFMENEGITDITDLLRTAGVLTDPEYATLDKETGVISLFLCIAEGSNLLVEAVIKSLNPKHFVTIPPHVEIGADFADELVDETRKSSLEAYGS